MSEVVLLIVSALIGAVTGILTTSWKTRKDLESAYDIELRKQQLRPIGRCGSCFSRSRFIHLGTPDLRGCGGPLEKAW